MARRYLKAGALTAPLPPVLVTVGNMEKANVLTVAWTGILSTIPPRTYVSIRPSRHSHAMLKESGEFVINLPSADMAKKVDYIGIYTGAKVDKFAVCGLTKVKSEQVSAPTLGECPIALECRVTEVLSMGTHDVFIADILAVSCDDDIIDEGGKMRFERANLLAYAHGEYFALGEKLGEFGFSTKKENKKPKTAAGGRAPKQPGEAKLKSKRKGEIMPKPSGDGEAHAENEKKPFYLTAPRAKRGGKGGAARPHRGGKK